MRCFRLCSATITLLLLVASLIGSTNLFAQQGKVNTSEVENAAVYYLKALDLLKYPNLQETKNKIQGIIKEGWQVESIELEEILDQNEMCFNELRRGFSLEKCDFYFGKKYNYLVEKKLPPLSKLRNISDLALLKSRYYENRRSFDNAIEICLSLLKFSYHISQDDTLIAKLLSLGIEKNIYIILRDYLLSGEASKETHQKMLHYLEVHEKRHFPARQLIETEKRAFLSNIKMLSDGMKIEDIINPEEKRKTIIFKKEFLEQADLLANRYYGLLIKAAETNKKEDWDIAYKEIRSLKEEVKKDNLEETLEYVTELVRTPAEYRNKKIASQIIKTILAITLPDYAMAVDRYYETMRELQKIKFLVKERGASLEP